jgi:hypothetical protein
MYIAEYTNPASNEAGFVNRKGLAKSRECGRYIPQELNRPRNKALVAAKIPKSKPQGLKPATILWHLRHDRSRALTQDSKEFSLK